MKIRIFFIAKMWGERTVESSLQLEFRSLQPEMQVAHCGRDITPNADYLGIKADDALVWKVAPSCENLGKPA
jgi:hypothetical protein